MKHALLTALVLLSGSAASAENFGTIPEDLQSRLAARKPLINGTDVSAALGTFRMDSPQLDCPMTVYGRFADGALGLWSDAELSFRPTFRFMSKGQSRVFHSDPGFGGYDSYLRAAVSRAASNGGRLDLYQETITGMRRGREVRESRTYLPARLQLSVDADGALTLRKSSDYSKTIVCSFRKISAQPGPIVPRVFSYAFDARVRVGGTAGTLHAAFDMEECSSFQREVDLRDFAWTIALDDGTTLGPELPLPAGDWRRTKAGFMSPGMVQPDIPGPFFAGLEADASTKIGGREHVLRIFLECEETLASCNLVPSAVTQSAPGFFAVPFSNFEKLSDVPVSMESGARIELKRRRTSEAPRR